VRHEITFVDPAVPTSDLHLFLGPFDSLDGPMMAIQPGWTMAHVMFEAKKFPSVKQAKNNGWHKPIPAGYSEYVVGKDKLHIYILTPF